MIANVRCIAAALALSAPLATPAVAATWSDTFLGYRYGTQFHEPNNTKDVRKHVLQFTHASGYSLGQNFVNMDVLQSDKNDPISGGDSGATEFYLTYRRQLGVPLPNTATAQELFNTCAAHGGAGWDHSALVRALEIMANFEIGQQAA